MFEENVRVRRWDCPVGRRLLVVSDIHGNLEYFKGLLKLCGFSSSDELIIDGDFLEKGPSSLETLHYVMALCEKGNVHPVIGNCDGWYHIFRDSPELDMHLMHYLRSKRCGLLWDMCLALDIDPLTEKSFTPVKAKLHEAFQREWAFLHALPHVIETEHLVFTHAGINPHKPIEDNTVDELTRCDRFMSLGHSFDKWVVVGHCPVVLYGEDKVCANPIIDREHRIISIDGGCVLKDDGQLNALIIPSENSEEFSFAAYDPFPERIVAEAQTEGERSYYIRWGDSTVQVLKRGGEFSHCRHLRTGYEMDILTKYLFAGGEFTGCNDCTDYVLPLVKGDVVRVVEESSKGYFVKHNGYSGWYYGKLEGQKNGEL